MVLPRLGDQGLALSRLCDGRTKKKEQHTGDEVDIQGYKTHVPSKKKKMNGRWTKGKLEY